MPSWLDTDHPDLTVVTHSQLFPNQSHLPTFSSPAIESHLHRLPGLAQHFIYFNDDVMLGAPTYPDDFKSLSDGTKIFLSWGVPTCSDGCSFRRIGDGICDENCNVKLCAFDGGDCDGDEPNYRYNNKKTFAKESESAEDIVAKFCSNTCPNPWIGDGVSRFLELFYWIIDINIGIAL